MFQGCALRVGRPKAYTGPPGSKEQEATRMLSTAGLNLAATGGEATSCIQMANMLTVEELREEYDDILDDVKGEMEKYGEVEALEIPRPPPAGEEVPDYIGIAFVHFKEKTSAIKAQIELEGRTFGGNNVACNFYPEDMFKNKEWCDILKKTAPPPLAPVATGEHGMIPANLLGGPAPPSNAIAN